MSAVLSRPLCADISHQTNVTSVTKEVSVKLAEQYWKSEIALSKFE